MKFDHLMRESFSVRILIVVMAILFALCVGPANSASEPGTITILMEEEPENLEPADSIRSLQGRVMIKNIMEALVEFNPDDSSISPRLATSWKHVDSTTWQFDLRKGVKFHDGADFNADAVIFNIKRLYEQKVNSGTRLKFFSHFKLEGKALNTHLLELKTDKVEPLLLTFLGNLFIASPNTASDKKVRNPMGTGPYKLAKWDAGTQIVLERFDGYWGKQPQVKKAVYLWRTESSVRAAMVAIGEADLAPNVSALDANRPDLDQSYLDSQTLYWRIGAWEPPLNDRRVRLALNYAVDRNAIRGSILSKDMVPATQLIVPSISGYNPDLKVWPYDPQKAKALIEEARKAGVPVNKEILLVANMRYPGSNEVVEAMMTMFRAVGLNAKIRILEDAVFVRHRNKPYPTNIGPYLLQNRHDNSYGDPVFTVFGKYHCDGNQSPICDKKMDALIEKAQVSLGEERKRLWQSIFKSLHEEIIPDVVLFHMVAYARVGKRINFKPSLATCNEIDLSQITIKQ